MSGNDAPPTAMTPTANPKAAAKAAKAYAKASRPWFKKKRWLLAGVALVVIIALVNGGTDRSDKTRRPRVHRPAGRASR